MPPLHELSTEAAIALLLDRRELTGRLKQALSTPLGEVNLPDVAPHIQRLLTPGADDAAGQAARSGLIGAVGGGLVGAGSSLFGDRRRHWLRNAITGAMLGGGAGAALPTGLNALSAALSNPPSVQSHEAQKAKQQTRMDEFAAPGVQPHALAGFTSPAAETSEQILGRSDANQYDSAGGAAAGLASRAAAQGGIGYGLGRGLDRLRPGRIRGLGADAIDKELGQPLGKDIMAGKRVPLTSAQRTSLTNKAPRGKMLPGVLGGVGAALPLIEAGTGVKIDPVGWVQRLVSGS